MSTANSCIIKNFTTRIVITVMGNWVNSLAALQSMWIGFLIPFMEMSQINGHDVYLLDTMFCCSFISPFFLRETTITLVMCIHMYWRVIGYLAINETGAMTIFGSPNSKQCVVYQAEE